VEAAVRGGHAKNARSQRPALGMEAESPLDRTDTVVKRQEIEDVTP
jgi:hypothetical protein